jgi:hypothetical protein
MSVRKGITGVLTWDKMHHPAKTFPRGTKTSTQIDFTSLPGPLDCGGGQAGPMFYSAQNSYPEPGPTMTSLTGAALPAVIPRWSEVMSSSDLTCFGPKTPKQFERDSVRHTNGTYNSRFAAAGRLNRRPPRLAGFRWLTPDSRS